MRDSSYLGLSPVFFKQQFKIILADVTKSGFQFTLKTWVKRQHCVRNGSTWLGQTSGHASCMKGPVFPTVGIMGTIDPVPRVPSSSAEAQCQSSFTVMLSLFVLLMRDSRVGKFWF